MKRLFNYLLLISALFIVGCSNNEENDNGQSLSYESLIVGEWEFYRYDYYDGRGGDVDNEYWIFNSDGSGYYYTPDITAQIDYFNWSIVGTVLHLGGEDLWDIESLTTDKMTLKLQIGPLSNEWVKYHFKKN